MFQGKLFLIYCIVVKSKKEAKCIQRLSDILDYSER